MTGNNNLFSDFKTPENFHSETTSRNCVDQPASVVNLKLLKRILSHAKKIVVATAGLKFSVPVRIFTKPQFPNFDRNPIQLLSILLLSKKKSRRNTFYVILIKFMQPIPSRSLMS